MSASNKKKLRKENAAAMLTEKQRQEQAEAKKLKAISVTFVVIMLVVALSAASILVIRAVNNSGVIDRNTLAATTGEHELNSVHLNYYFNDYIRNMYEQWHSMYGESVTMYTMMMGLDLNKPLDKQVYDKESGDTWADYFLKSALDKAKSDFALYDKAMAENFTLTKEEQEAFDSNMAQLDFYAMYYGYKNADKYLSASYGYGSDAESYIQYRKIATIASAYYTKHQDSLKYEDSDIREHEKKNPANYSSFSYSSYYVNSSDYLKGGTTSESGSKVYSDAEKQAALAAAEEVAKKLAENKNVLDLDKAIAALEINKDKKDVATTKNTLMLYTSIPTALQSWLADEKRQDGEIAVVPNETTSKDEDGKETKTVNGYYVVVFQGRDNNLRPLANVRHLLVKFKGGTTDKNGNKVYSDTEKAAAKAEAERLLNVWKEGKATEETFIAMVKQYSDDGSASTGGLFEDIHKASGYVDSFKNWSLDTARKPGDTGVIVSEYGYHVMYYSSDDALTYRDYMITEDLRTAEMEEWYDAIFEAATITAVNTNRLNMDMIIGHSH